MKKLQEIWKQELGDHIVDFDSEDGKPFEGIINYIKPGTENEKPPSIYPLLNIGQMIELLAEKKAFVHFTIWDSKSETKGINYHKIAIIDGIGEDCSQVQYES